MPSPHSHPLLLRVWIADALRHFWPHERAFHMDDWWGFLFSASIFSCSCFAFISFNCALRTCSYCLSASSFRPRSLSLSAIKGRSLRGEPISSKQRPQEQSFVRWSRPILSRLEHELTNASTANGGYCRSDNDRYNSRPRSSTRHGEW